jgi:hypothetical protein
MVPQGRLLSWFTVGALSMLVLAAASLSADSSPGPTATPPSVPQETSLAGFAGYDLIAPLGEIAADFTVPSILKAPPRGTYATASTWIGAQNAMGEFVQIGVTESASSDLPGEPDLAYNGFWSSTALDFHPDSFAKVQPGDRIAVSMVLRSKGWVIRFDDESSGTSRTIQTDYGGGASFNAAEWIQEDPISSTDLLRNLPYPQTSVVSFSQVEADGRVPYLGYDDERAMDVPGGPWLVPTSFRSDGFIVEPATGAAKQYLADVAGYNLAEQEFSIAVFGPRPGTDDGEIMRATTNLVASLDEFENQLSIQSWPPATEGDVQALLTASYETSVDLRTLEDGPTLSGETLVYTDEGTSQEAAEVLRMSLGLPPPA